MLPIKKLFLILSALAIVNGSIYPQIGIVVNVDVAADIVTCEDYNGFLWQFEGAEDWQENDIASFVMFDMGTKNIKDDIILSVKYNGGVEWFAR